MPVRRRAPSDFARRPAAVRGSSRSSSLSGCAGLGQGAKPSSKLRRVLPPADQRRGVDQQLRIGPRRSPSPSPCERKREALSADRTQNRHAEPRDRLTARGPVRRERRGACRSFNSPSGQRSLELDVRIRVGGARDARHSASVGECSRKGFAQLQGIFAHVRGSASFIARAYLRGIHASNRRAAAREREPEIRATVRPPPSSSGPDRQSGPAVRAAADAPSDDAIHSDWPVV